MSIAFISLPAWADESGHTERLEKLNATLGKIVSSVVEEMGDVGLTEKSSLMVLPESNFDDTDLTHKKLPQTVRYATESNFLYVPDKGIQGNLNSKILINVKSKNSVKFNARFKLTTPSTLSMFQHFGKMMSADIKNPTPDQLKQIQAGKKLVRAKNLTEVREVLISIIDFSIADAPKAEEKTNAKAINFYQLLGLVKRDLTLSEDGKSLAILLQNLTIEDQPLPEGFVLERSTFSVHAQSVDFDVKFSFTGKREVEQTYNSLLMLNGSFNTLITGNEKDADYRMSLGAVRSWFQWTSGIVGFLFNSK